MTQLPATRFVDRTFAVLGSRWSLNKTPSALTPRARVVILRAAALCVMVSMLWTGPNVTGQELIGPGIQSASDTQADDLPAPSFSNASGDSITNDRLEEYRRTLEEHLLKKERAKLEARARFESRSRDLMPSPVPPKRLMSNPDALNPDASKSGAVDASEAMMNLREAAKGVEDLPTRAANTIKKFSATDADTGSSDFNEDSLPSPSDMKRVRDPSLDELLGPPLPTGEEAPRDSIRGNAKESTQPRPQRLSTPDQPKPTTPQRLGGGSASRNTKSPNPFPKLPPRQEPRRLPKFEVVPEAERQANTKRPQTSERPQPDQRQPPGAASAIARDRISPTAPTQESTQSVLEHSPSYDNDNWSQMVDAERYRWGTPVSFRGNYPISDVHCSSCGGCVDRKGVGCIDRVGVMAGVGTRERARCQCWRCPQQAPFDTYGVGGYVGPARTAPVAEYRLRGGDQIQLTFLIKTVRTVGAYRLVVGDELLIESDADANLTRGSLERGLEVQPDGTITLRFIGQVHAAGQTIEQLRTVLNERYEEFYPDPSIDVTPVQTNNVARQIREAISGSEGFNPQQAVQTVTPEGTIRLPRLGAVPTQGLTMGELKREINLRYDSLGAGLEVEVVLEQQAPHFVYVLGEVAEPGQFELTTPTTVLGGLSLAGSYIPGANLRQVVIFRRGVNWELVSTMLDLRAAIFGKASRPADEIWLQDGDVIIVPPTPIQVFDRFVQQVFTDGIYGIAPFVGNGIFFDDNNN